jgi:quercetin dioxygenase-like cupin family protein
MDRTEFEAKLHADGFTDISAREMEPGKFNAEHSHEFTARLLILDGEIVLTHGGEARTYRAGDTCELAAGTPHIEQCGEAGVRYVAGRRYA